MFLHLSVILFTGGSVCIWSGGPVPWEDTPLGRHPPGQTPTLPGQTPPLPSACWDIHTSPPSACWDTVNKWAVRIPLECILVFKKFNLYLITGTAYIFTFPSTYSSKSSTCICLRRGMAPNYPPPPEFATESNV